ncbi:MAG: cellobiose phosphorylase [Candidatus Omnitrophota bacterium]
MHTKKARYYLNPRGEFIVENYNFSKPFANFFPGIAGKYGIPLWAFYVNRGQAIISFGTRDKNHAILEFFPANKAWQFASLQGFRTFIKTSAGKNVSFYEPFHNGFTNLRFSLMNRMRILPYELTLEEENLSLSLKVKVEYFTVPNDYYAGLARILTIENMGRNTRTIEALDGLPQIVPFGTSNLFLKKLGRTIEAWMNTENLKQGVPFYKLRVDPTDRPEVVHIKEGNFYLAFCGDKKGKTKIITPIVDPQAIFGPVTDFSCPYEFITRDNFNRPYTEVTQNKTSCAFSPLTLTLKAGEDAKLYSLIGYMPSQEKLNSSLRRIASPDYLKIKREENKGLITGLTSDIDTKSSSREFNLYAQQTYLDNIMRGGYPVTFGDTRSVFYLYSRKHGDLERDYNNFQLQPTYFSQGNGNYRDINQNRRCDIWFNPDIKDGDIATFINLLQTDGFNPLILKSVNYSLNDRQSFSSIAERLVEKGSLPALLDFLSRPFTPGSVAIFIEENRIKLKLTRDELLTVLLSHSSKNQEAEHGEGFWTDHWTYNLDLLENYLAVYPEEEKRLIFNQRHFTFFDNIEVVKPRQMKYVLYEGRVRQFHSVYADPEKKEIILKRTAAPHKVRTQYGKGDIYTTTLVNKLFSLLVNKISSLDPFGTGIEMEANKPNWYDALNGLPGLFGSSICETFQLKRLAIFLKAVIKRNGIESIPLTEEVREFLDGLRPLISEYLKNKDGQTESDYTYWEKSYTLKEAYREKTRLGVSGKEIETSSSELLPFLDEALKKLDAGIKKALDDKKGVYYAYFINKVEEFIPLKPPFVKPLRFKQIRLPFFLESQVHALRLAPDKMIAQKLHASTRKSLLYDKTLKMYKVTAPLSKMPEEIGRCRVFTPGWLENESIWLHMEYKYILELLKSGLHKEFYQDFRNVLIPFQDPKRYGRSILENSSFIVSSAFPDEKLHGNGFVARLSGSTAEFLQIWLIMNIGLSPFVLDTQRKLNLRLQPILPKWLFTKKGSAYTFKFMGGVNITYHNPGKKDTFGSHPAKCVKIKFLSLEGDLVEIPSDTIPHPFAAQIRSRSIPYIDAYLE